MDLFEVAAERPEAADPDAYGEWDQTDETDGADEALAYLREVLDRDDDSGPHGLPAPSPAVPIVAGSQMPALIFSHSGPLDPEKITPLEQDRGVKPLGGLWAVPGAIDQAQPTAWEALNADASLRSSTAVRSQVRFADDARVAKIDSVGDLVALALECPNEPGWDRDYVEAFGDRGPRPLDWSKVAERYDAVWVTDRAIASSRGLDETPDRGRFDLGVWDFESVIVTNPAALR